MAMVILAAALASPPASVSTCRAMAVAAGAGDVVGPEDTVAAPCPSSASMRKLRYDRRAKAARALVDLVPGDDLGRVYLPTPPRVAPGDRIGIAAWIGRVVVAREVTAMQAEGSGNLLFVRDDAGKVFRASLHDEGEDAQ